MKNLKITGFLIVQAIFLIHLFPLAVAQQEENYLLPVVLEQPARDNQNTIASSQEQALLADLDGDGVPEFKVPEGMAITDMNADGVPDLTLSPSSEKLSLNTKSRNSVIPAVQSTKYSTSNHNANFTADAGSSSTLILTPPGAPPVYNPLSYPLPYHKVWDSTGTYLENIGEQLVADLDFDNKSDIVVSDYNGPAGADVATLSIFENSGDNQFTIVWTYSDGNPFVYTDMAAGDVDGDGQIELVVGRIGGFYWGYNFVLPRVFIFGATADNTYTLEQVIQIPNATMGLTSLKKISLGDINNDGKIDIVAGIRDWETMYTPGWGSQIVAYTYSSGNYQQILNYTTTVPNYSYYVTAMATGDSDNDGKPEIQFFENTSIYLHLLEYENGQFVHKKIPTGIQPGFAVDMLFSDLDNDTQNELLVGGAINPAPGGTIYVIKSTGNDTYQLAWSYSAGVGSSILSVNITTSPASPVTFAGSSHADYSSLQNDILIVQYNPAINSYEVQNHLKISQPTLTTLPSISIGDFDDDQKQDIVFTEFTTSNTTGLLTMYEEQ